MAPTIITRAEAKALGLTRYFTGVTCIRGHLDQRSIRGGCLACKREDSKKSSSSACKRRYADSPEGKAYHKTYRELHKDKIAAYRDKYRQQPGFKEKVLRNRLSRNYGLTVEQYEAMLIAQDNKCACCPRVFGSSKANLPHVDHDHTTGNVRSILCPKCNMGIGLADEDTERLQTWIRYLRSHRGS